MSVTTPHPGPPNPGTARQPGPPPQGKPAGPPAPAARPDGRARRRAAGASLGALPVTNLVVLEVGIAIGLVLLAIDLGLMYVAGGIAFLALVFAFARRRGRWLTQWIGLTVRYNFRSHSRTAKRDGQTEMKPPSEEETSVIGPEDPRVALLR